MAANAKIIQRSPASTRFVDRSGYVNPQGVTFIRHLGFGVKRDGDAAKASIWLCKCPKCGEEYNEWHTAVYKTRGCTKCFTNKVPPGMKQLRIRWTRRHQACIQAGLLGGAWLDRETFVRDMLALEQRIATDPSIGGRRYIGPDLWKPDAPFSPECHSLGFVTDDCDPTILGNRLMIYCGERRFLMSEPDCPPVWILPPAVSIALGLTRQRVHQMSDELVMERLRQAIAIGVFDDLFASARANNR